MQVWFTADTHFGHGNIIKYCQRPFMSREERAATRADSRAKIRLSDETVKRHDDALLEAINSRVAVDDHLRTSVPGIYAAGDVVGPPALVTVSV